MSCRPDVVLRSSGEVLASTDVAILLPMFQEKIDYILSVNEVQTLKDCRQLKVKGSVSNGKVIISVQTGTDTPRTFEFENDTDIKLIENLKKGDKIIFLYSGNETTVSIRAKISKKY